MMSESSLPSSLPHGPLLEQFPDVWFMTGMVQMEFQGTALQFSRNMTVVRSGSALTLINAFRLNDEGLARLDALGEVTHVIRLGFLHGRDDAFYRSRNGATVWGLAPMMEAPDHGIDRALEPGGELPFADGRLFAFETTAAPEGIVVLEREGGILVTCDSLQNWARTDEFWDEPTKAAMGSMGFVRPTSVSPAWMQLSGVQPGDFTRLRALEFRHVLPGHGQPVKDDAHARYSATFDSLFESSGP